MTSPFIKHSANKYSQNGEDGIIEEILRQLRLTADDNWCVEFGAWDGKHLSNTFKLVEEGWNAVYIEGDGCKYKDLLVTCKSFSRIIPIEAFVSPDQYSLNSLDKLLANTKIKNDFALLSIDIDSYDLDVWESLSNYQPKIVIIEINSGIAPGIYQRHNPSIGMQGNSFTSTLRVAHQKGYSLVCHTGNCIFVDNTLLSRLDIDKHLTANPFLLFEFKHLYGQSKQRSILRRGIKKCGFNKDKIKFLLR